MNNFESQVKKVLNHLQENKSITSWEAITKYHATRLSAIIYTLRDKGYDIETEMIDNYDEDGKIKGRFAKYWLR